MKKKKLNSVAAISLSATLFFSALPPTASLAVTKIPGDQRPILERLEHVGNEINANSASRLDNDQKQFSENQLVIHYSSPITESEHSEAGGRLIKRISSLSYDVIEVQGGAKLEDIAKAYAKLSKVTSISKSALVKKLVTPNLKASNILPTPDLKASDMYYLNNLNVEQAQEIAGKNKVRVAVIDTGIDANHPELTNKIAVNYNAMDPMKKGQPDSHGTHVTGIIAAEKNNVLGGYGIAPNSEIVSIDVFNRSAYGTDYVIAEGILEATRQNVDIINMSLGSWQPSPILRDAVKKAIDSGIVIVAAAGNDGFEHINYPASYDGVISVGATDEEDDLTNFSTYGPSVDVTAPGNNIYSSVYSFEKGSSFVKMSGTSMASPMVAGAVSLLLSKYPDLTAYQVSYILTHTAKDLGEKGYDTKYGYGMIDLVKMLSFDPKTIPAQSVVSADQILEKAKNLPVTTETSETTVEGSLEGLEQTDYYKVTVEKDQYVQVNLQGASQYDLKYMLKFYPEGENNPEYTSEVNDGAAGKQEGSLYKAPKKGTVVLAVKDSFGQYSETGNSKYTLKVSRKDQLNDDGNTMETPVVLGSLPSTTSLSNYYTDELLIASPAERKEQPIPGDSDFYRFKVPGIAGDPAKAMKINVSAVAGMDPSLKLHMINSYVNDDGTTVENNNVIDQFNTKGYGKSESMSITVLPGSEYMVEVTNKPSLSDYEIFIGKEIDFNRNYSSQNPYQVSFEITSQPADEDHFPISWKETVTENALAEGKIAEYLAKKEEINRKLTNLDFSLDEAIPSYYDLIKDVAIPYEIGTTQKGYFQYSSDEDWIKVTPNENSVFEMNFTNKEGYNVPIVLIHKYNEKKNDIDTIYSSMDLNTVAAETELKGKNPFYIGLKKGETYFFRISDALFRPSFDPYEFKLSPVFSNANDAYEDNDTFNTAKTISTDPIKGSLSSIGDIDTFYFKPDKTAVYSAIVQPDPLPEEYSKAHDELKQPLDSTLLIYEDTNGNGKLEEDEEGNLRIVEYGYENQPEIGSFRAENGRGYFFKILNFYKMVTTLSPYTFTIKEAPEIDEDAESVMKNNIPSKPVTLESSNGEYTQAGYINMTEGKGDTDYYKFIQKENGKRTIKLEVPFDLDGIVTVYDSKGTQIAKSDYYDKADYEILQAVLKKGTYYMKVEELNGNASALPYKLTVK
ncbi:S8 family peptidase [Neobacillus sp. NPDC093182]|uniref:S8 family peptidase n=1 Tax=Neobacillus sp. NPDC093182 TaxID=3364297 RepID=UPI0038095F0D